jgi:hypothetical protein
MEFKVPLSEFIDMCDILAKFVVRDVELPRRAYGPRSAWQSWSESQHWMQTSPPMRARETRIATLDYCCTVHDIFYQFFMATAERITLDQVSDIENFTGAKTGGDCYTFHGHWCLQNRCYRHRCYRRHCYWRNWMAILQFWETMVVSSSVVSGATTLKFHLPGRVLVGVRRLKNKGQPDTIWS